MSSGVPAVLALDPVFSDAVFPPDTLARLRRRFDLRGPFAQLGSVDLRKTEALITGWGAPSIDADILDQAPNLRAIIHSAGSVKGIVGAEVFERGIVVSSAAVANARPVAEYTAAVAVLASKGVLPPAALTRLTGADSIRPDGIGLLGSTVGVVGASRIGRLVAVKLVELGARVLLADPYATQETAAELGAELTDLDSLCLRSDIVTIHAPQLPETLHMFDKRRLALMPDGAVLVNTARGSLVDHDALADECTAGRLRAVLDVTDPEPLPADHPLHRLPDVLITPHLAGASGRERRLLGEFAADEAERFLAGEPLTGLVRLEDLERSA
ncbi:hydroxyacid dehydrogenase [Streptomyces lavendulocolor]|uniref:hydroxyacid dehydrogenase n=1 Tax=Streptomyces lavendulocolor TaxID=67316 RepID=UPI003C2B41F8